MTQWDDTVNIACFLKFVLYWYVVSPIFTIELGTFVELHNTSFVTINFNFSFFKNKQHLFFLCNQCFISWYLHVYIHNAYINVDIDV